MRDQITALEALQQVDLELKGLKENLEKYPQEISRYNKELEDAKKFIAKAKEELDQITKKKTKMELKLAENQDTIKRAEGRLFEIKTYREYEALQKEISEAKKANAELQEETLKDMEQIENLEILIKERELKLAEKEKEYGQIINSHSRKINELEKVYEIKNQEKKKVALLVNPEILSMYERIRRRNGVALVPAKDEACTGCNMNIPPQLFNEVLRNARMVQCPNCHRILYSEETDDGEFQTA